MSRLFICILFLSLCVKSEAQIVEELQHAGIENIRYLENENNITVSFENNVYRSVYSGIGKAINACLKSSENIKEIQLVVLDNNIPRLLITLPKTLLKAYQSGDISQEIIYRRMVISTDTDNAIKMLRGSGKMINPSAWKTDIVVYPELFLKNTSFNKLYTYAISLSPALEMGLWKGGKLTAQVVLPVATNLYGEYRKIHPGVMTLSQEVRLKYNFLGRITAGNFTHNRMGAQMEMRYTTGNGRLEIGALLGSTVYSGVVEGEGWYISTRQRINAAIMASVYEPHTNLQFDLQAGRYIYGDYGARGDCTRHFGEYAVGLYGMYIEGEFNGGFHLSIPLPGRKWKRVHGFRIKPADYFAWTYSLVSHGKFIDERMGRSYDIKPGENKSGNFYQPDFIRYFLIKEQEKNNEQ